MPRRTKTKDRYIVGSPIAFSLGGVEWHGVILEDRGPIGSGGRRMLRSRSRCSHASRACTKADCAHAAATFGGLAVRRTTRR